MSLWSDLAGIARRRLASPGTQELDEAYKERLGRFWWRSATPWRRLVQPVFFGHENVPARGPAIWIGNHSLYAFADAWLMVGELYDKHGIVLRALGSHHHFRFPLWGHALAASGVVDGTRENCAALLAAGEHVLIYPGGGGEVFKRIGEKHQLRWKQRTGFARLALEHDCPIVPFATVGADDCWDIVYDNDRLRETWIGRAVVAYGGVKPEELPAVVLGLGHTPFPRPERMYFRFLPPVRPDAFRGLPIERAAQDLRARVEHEVQSAIDDLLAYREKDEKRSFRARILERRAAPWTP